MLYQRVTLSSSAKIGDPAALPAELVGFSDATLANLPAALDPCPDAWADTGFTPVIEAVGDYVVDVPTFMLRFTPVERVAIRKSTDPLVQDFMTLLSDPRTERVNLQLPAVQQAVGYLAGMGGDPLMASPILTPDRAAAVLAAEPA